jgi:hypothetical protein
MNATIRNHLEGRRLKAEAADDAEVLGFWKKALVARGDATNSTGSMENRLLRAYDAARLAATAIVREAGYRASGSEGHHYVTFDVARSLVREPALKNALDAMNTLRKVRHDVEYEAEGEVDEKTMAKAFRGAEQVIALGRVHLGEQRPNLQEQLSSS